MRLTALDVNMPIKPRTRASEVQALNDALSRLASRRTGQPLYKFKDFKEPQQRKHPPHLLSDAVQHADRSAVTILAVIERHEERFQTTIDGQRERSTCSSSDARAGCYGVTTREYERIFAQPLPLNARSST